MGRRRITWALATALVGSFGLGAVCARAETSAAGNQALAQRDAARHLGLLQVPPDATPSDTEPSDDGSLLANAPGRPATPNLIDVHAWWVVPGDPKTALDWIQAHAPPGWSVRTSGHMTGGGRPDYSFVGFGWRAVPNRLDERLLYVSAVQRPDGTTGLRADSQVVWQLPRLLSELVPYTATSVRIMVLDPDHRYRPIRVVDPGKIGQITASVNRLPLMQPAVRSCPVFLSPPVRLIFRERSAGPPLAIATADPQSCEVVHLTINGQRQPDLFGHGLVARLEKLLRTRLTTPRP